MKRSKITPARVEKDEELESLLQQLRESQGPGDCLVEINIGGSVDPTSITDVEEVVQFIIDCHSKMEEFEKKYSSSELMEAQRQAMLELSKKEMSPGS